MESGKQRFLLTFTIMVKMTTVKMIMVKMITVKMITVKNTTMG